MSPLAGAAVQIVVNSPVLSVYPVTKDISFSGAANAPAASRMRKQAPFAQTPSPCSPACLLSTRLTVEPPVAVETVSWPRRMYALTKRLLSRKAI